MQPSDCEYFHSVQDHVHDRDDVGEGLLFLPVEGALLQGAILRGGALGVLGAEESKDSQRKPAEPTAGSQMVSPSRGAVTATMARMSGRGV